MKRVIGIGGIFFKSKNPGELAAWYQKHLGIDFGGKVYADFKSSSEDKGWQAFSFFNADTKYFEPSEKEFMINLRVDNLDALLEALRAEGVHVFDKTEEYEYGKFGWILDPEGNKIELWEPIESAE
ncbi:MAG TPA: VOC family protein [Pyrinomonadaceae bacterium]|jgi:predicted enzyme related to lactoylglutathione lyase